MSTTFNNFHHFLLSQEKEKEKKGVNSVKFFLFKIFFISTAKILSPKDYYNLNNKNVVLEGLLFIHMLVLGKSLLHRLLLKK